MSKINTDPTLVVLQCSATKKVAIKIKCWIELESKYAWKEHKTLTHVEKEFCVKAIINGYIQPKTK